MTTTTESRALVLIVGVVLGSGVTSGVLGISGYLTAAGLLAAGLGWLLLAMLRRERRIRARLADPRTIAHPGRVLAGPVLAGRTPGRGRGVA